MIESLSFTLNHLQLNKAKHIQEVDLWIVDAKTLKAQTITSYKNRALNDFLLFIINDDEDIQHCLKQGFSCYLKFPLYKNELKSWVDFFKSQTRDNRLHFYNGATIDFEKRDILFKKERYSLTKQEMSLIKELALGDFVTTAHLKTALKVNSEATIRALISRLKLKAPFCQIVMKKGRGYRLELSTIEKMQEPRNENYEALQEQNLLLQMIIDSSPIYIATFIHKQLYCINHSFRKFLGTQMIKELWEEAEGDFFQVLFASKEEREELREKIFDTGVCEVRLYNSKSKDALAFEVQTCYFQNLDKHLLIFRHHDDKSAKSL